MPRTVNLPSLDVYQATPRDFATAPTPPYVQQALAQLAGTFGDLRREGIAKQDAKDERAFREEQNRLARELQISIQESAQKARTEADEQRMTFDREMEQERQGFEVGIRDRSRRESKIDREEIQYGELQLRHIGEIAKLDAERKKMEAEHGLMSEYTPDAAIDLATLNEEYATVSKNRQIPQQERMVLLEQIQADRMNLPRVYKPDERVKPEQRYANRFFTDKDGRIWDLDKGGQPYDATLEKRKLDLEERKIEASKVKAETAETDARTRKLDAFREKTRRAASGASPTFFPPPEIDALRDAAGNLTEEGLTKATWAMYGKELIRMGEKPPMDMKAAPGSPIAQEQQAMAAEQQEAWGDAARTVGGLLANSPSPAAWDATAVQGMVEDGTLQNFVEMVKTDPEERARLAEDPTFLRQFREIVEILRASGEPDAE